jgi:zinc transporter
MGAAPPSAEGVDQSGLVYGYVFSADGIGREIDTQAAIKWLARGDEVGLEFIWIHFTRAHATTQQWLQGHLDLPEAFTNALEEGSRSTRVEHAHRSLIAVVNDVEYDVPRKESLDVATLWLSAGPRYLLSIQSQSLRSVEQLRVAVEAGESFFSPLALVIHLLREQADVLVHILRGAADTVNGIEDNLLANQLPKRANLGVIRRDLVRLQRLLAPEPAALFRLINRPPTWVRAEDIQGLHQATEAFSVVLRDMAGLQERIKLLQEEIAARVGEHTNRTVFVLTAVTVVALPITLIGSLLGMNVGGVPFHQDPDGFWIVVVLAVLTTALAAWLIFRIWKN